jgi:cyanate lyase
VLAEMVENPLPKDRGRIDLHRHPLYYGLRNHIIDFLVSRSRNFAAEVPDHDPRKVPLVRIGRSAQGAAGADRPDRAYHRWRAESGGRHIDAGHRALTFRRGERPMKRSDLTEKLLDIKREKGWSWKHICEKIGGYSEVLIVGAILGQMKLTKPQAANAGELFGLSKTEVAILNETPMRGEGIPMPPTDPLIYRFYELVMVNGPAWKALIEEEFGDGIMSAIDFDMVMERLPNPKGDRVKITMSGKFLPFKYYGASGNVPEYGFKEG